LIAARITISGKTMENSVDGRHFPSFIANSEAKHNEIGDRNPATAAGFFDPKLYFFVSIDSLTARYGGCSRN